MRLLIAVIAVLMSCGCSSGKFSSSSFNSNAKHAYQVLIDVTNQKPIDKGDLRATLDKLEPMASSQNDKDMLFALNGSYGYLMDGTGKGISCLLAARWFMEGKDLDARELAHCRAEVQ